MMVEAKQQGSYAGMEPIAPKNNRQRLVIILAVLAGLLLVLISGAGGYWYATSYRVTVESPESGNPPKQPSQGEEAVHFVRVHMPVWSTSRGLTIDLGVPVELQATTRHPSKQDLGNTALFIPRDGQLVYRRWQFGNPSLSDLTGSGRVTFVQILDSWKSETSQQPDYTDYPHKIDDPRLNFNSTPSEKQSFLEALRVKAEGAVNSGDGFVIADNIKVITTIEYQPQASGSYEPYMYMLGIGAFEGKDFIVEGYITLDYTENHTAEEADELTARLLAGDIPQSTQDVARRYVEALKQTKITIE